MRLLTLALFVLLAPAASAQVVTSFPLDAPTSMDAISTGIDGTLYAAAGFRGSAVYTLSRTGTVTAIADGLDGPIEVAQAPDGTLFATNFNAAEVSRISATGEVEPYASTRPGPAGLLAGPDGTLYLTEYGPPTSLGGTTVAEIEPEGFAKPYASGGTLSSPVGIARSEDGTLYVANIFDGRITRVTPDGTQSLFASLPPTSPFTIGHLVWAGGRLYATYLGANQVWVFEPDGSGSVYAGSGSAGQDDGPASEATFDQPNGITASVTGDTLFVSELGAGPTDRIRMIVPATTATEGPAPPAQRLQLAPGYPNPFANATTLRFTLGAPAEVTLTVFDVLGREVDRVPVGPRPAGTHSVAWRPDGLAAGAYLLRLTAGGAYATRTVAYRP
ncbi:MAG: FlgD immunoglobulin-like domain containing protein [Bacteroidota bacterium]